MQASQPHPIVNNKMSGIKDTSVLMSSLFFFKITELGKLLQWKHGIWHAPSTVIGILVYFHSPILFSKGALLNFLYVVHHRHSHWIRDKSQHVRAATTTDDGKKERKYKRNHLSYQFPLSLPIFTRLMAMETGSGIWWCLGLVDRRHSQRIIAGFAKISALCRLINSAI